MQLTVDGYMGTVLLQYRVYIFQSLAIALHAVCIYEPLVRIFLNKFKVKENKVISLLNKNFLYFFILFKFLLKNLYDICIIIKYYYFIKKKKKIK